MVTIKEMFEHTYVIVPMYVDSGCGYHCVERYDMNDDEWKTWLKVKNLKNVKHIMNKKLVGKTKLNEIRSVLMEVVDVMKGEGVLCALVNTPEANDIRNEVYQNSLTY